MTRETIPPFRDPVGLEPDGTVSVDTTGSRTHAPSGTVKPIPEWAKQAAASPWNQGDSDLRLQDDVWDFDDVRKANGMTGDFYGDGPEQQVTQYDPEAEAAARAQDTTLRDGIARYWYDYADTGHDVDDEINRRHADDILAMIRDALLSDPALIAAGRVRITHRGTGDVITAALNAAGIGGTDGE